MKDTSKVKFIMYKARTNHKVVYELEINLIRFIMNLS